MTAPHDLRLPEITDAGALSRAIGDAGRPALILFDAAWCSPARRIEERLLRLFSGQCLELLRVNVDRLPEIARRFGIHAVPTMALFRFGQVAATRLGEVGDRDLMRWLEEECADAAA
jgi:thioredoxin-like negative regulator of GroEL